MTTSVEETFEFGKRLGLLLQPGDIVTLFGELGSGKTQLVKGIACGMGISSDTPVTSPTYTLMQEYTGRFPLYHFDLYRLSGADDVVELGFEEYFYGNGISVIEWSERLGADVPPESLSLSFTLCGENCRRISIEPKGSRNQQLCHILFEEQ